MQTIQIKTIQINSISNIGSLNIGNVILARNSVTTIDAGGETDSGLAVPLAQQDEPPEPVIPPPILPGNGRTSRNPSLD